MKFWIDDVRPAPEGWTWLKTSEEALDFIYSWLNDEALDDNDVVVISYDHDLGGEDTAVPVAEYFEELAAEGVVFEYNATVHSANPVGKKHLLQIIESTHRFLR